MRQKNRLQAAAAQICTGKLRVRRGATDQPNRWQRSTTRTCAKRMSMASRGMRTWSNLRKPLSTLLKLQQGRAGGAAQRDAGELSGDVK